MAEALIENLTQRAELTFVEDLPLIENLTQGAELTFVEDLKMAKWV